MKISMWTSFLYGRSFESIIRSLHDAGFDSADLSVEHLDEMFELPEGTVLERRDFARENGVPLLQTHLSLESDLTMPPGPEAARFMDVLKRELELSVLMGNPAFESSGEKSAQHPEIQDAELKYAPETSRVLLNME